jgi:hypothetical protein
MAAQPASPGTAQPEATTLTGVVTSDAGAPLIAATVFVEGLGVGGATRADGRYSFVVPAGRAAVSGCRVCGEAHALRDRGSRSDGGSLAGAPTNAP